MSEHEVTVKLRHDILPWIESAKLLRRQWYYRMHRLGGYATDLTVALGAALNKLLDEKITPTIDHHTGENSYPWVGPAPDEMIDTAIEKRVAELKKKFELKW